MYTVKKELCTALFSCAVHSLHTAGAPADARIIIVDGLSCYASGPFRDQAKITESEELVRQKGFNISDSEEHPLSRLQEKYVADNMS